jgi:hypothetical protein
MWPSPGVVGQRDQAVHRDELLDPRQCPLTHPRPEVSVRSCLIPGAMCALHIAGLTVHGFRALYAAPA